MRSHRSVLATLMAVATLLGLIGSVAPAHALAPGTFEGKDGNLVVNTPGNKDWVNAPNFTFGVDKPTGKTDDSFAGGTKEDTVNPTVVTGSIPNNKDDLARFYVANEKAGGKDFLYLAWIRNNTGGSANMDFELNQSIATYPTGIPVRTDGDLLIGYAFVSSKTPTLMKWTWLTSASEGSCEAAGSVPCWGNGTVLTDAVSEGAVNDGFSVVDPTPPGGGKTLLSQTFGEAAINLTDAGIFPAGKCENFGRAYLKSRSSQSFGSEMKDFIAPISIQVSNCATKTFNLTYTSPAIAGTTSYAVYTTPDGVTHSLQLQPTGTGSTYTASDASIQPGSTLTGVHLEIRNADGTVAWRTSPDQTETITASTTNSASFSYALTLSPKAAENFVGKPHTFTATVTGTGTFNGQTTTAPLVGVNVSFATFGGTPAGCGTLTPATSPTNALGQATTTLSSATPCSTSLRAWVNSASGTSGFDAGEVSDTATKSFVAYNVTVTPASATNVIGTNHTFTATLTRDSGSGPVGYAGQTLTLSISDPSNTGAHFVSINGVSASGTTGTCTTSSTGTCTVVATATRTGTFSLNASYTTTNDSGSGTFSGSGTKTYEDIRILVSPPTATNELGVPHTFTVTLQRDTGSGFVAFAGQTVSLTLNPGNSNAHFTDINGSPASGTTGSCVTRTDGTCSVTIVATTPGLATLTARYTTTLASGTLTRTATATKQYSSFNLTVNPPTATNELGVPHTFTVTLTRNDGTGSVGYAGQTLNLTLNPGTSNAHFTDINGSPATGTTGSCVTRADGTCSVTIVATTPGTVTLTATWSQQLTDSTATRTATATKSYISISVSKLPCATSAPANGLIRFDIPWSTSGQSITNAKIIDNLPPQLLFQSSTPAASSAPPVGQSGQVVVTLASPLPNPASGTVSIVVAIAPGTPNGTVITNSGAFVADGGISKPFSTTITVSSAGAAASGRAYGAQASLLGGTVLAPTPDVTNGASQLASLPANSLVSAGILAVSNVPTVTSTQADDNASATAANVDVELTGVSVKATAVAARSHSTATGSTATTTTSGSEVLGLTVNGATVGDVSSPRVITVLNLAGVAIAEVSVLEQVGASGAALGGAAGAQPQNGLFSSGLGVNGLHVRLLDNTADVIVSHAESKASFPTLNPCAGTGPYVIGSAVIANELLTYPTGPTTVIEGGVLLPSTGGDVISTVNTLDLAPLGATSGTGSTETKGALSPLNAMSTATLQNLALSGLTATLVSSSATANPATAPALSGSTTITKLVIGTLNVCNGLGLAPTCTPPPNTVLIDLTRTLKIVLNEQVISGKQLTVNAVHIFVLGASNPLGLPIGSDLVLSGSTAGTS